MKKKENKWKKGTKEKDKEGRRGKEREIFLKRKIKAADVVAKNYIF